MQGWRATAVLAQPRRKVQPQRLEVADTELQSLIAAVAPFTVETGPIDAFTAGHGDASYDALLIGYVSTFVPKQTGEQFSPHVSTGVAPRDYLDKMLAEPFELFTFSPAGAAVCQFVPFGTAARNLKEWNLKP